MAQGMIRVRVEGATDIVKRIQAQKTQFMRRTEKAVYDQLARVVARSTELVPVDTGRLRDSVYVAVTKGGVRAEHVRGEAGYQTEYAELVHERVDIPHRDGKIAKFLEVAWLMELPDAQMNLTNIIFRGERGFAYSTQFDTPAGGGR